MKVEFKSVYKRYGNFTAVSDLCSTIVDGALHFLLGPSGCGKTTTLRMLAGLESISEGRIFVRWKGCNNLPASEKRHWDGFPKLRSLASHDSLSKHRIRPQKRKLSKEEIEARIEEVLDFTQLTNFSKRLPGQLSGGQQQRVALARALGNKAERFTTRRTTFQLRCKT